VDALLPCRGSADATDAVREAPTDPAARLDGRRAAQPARLRGGATPRDRRNLLTSPSKARVRKGLR